MSRLAYNKTNLNRQKQASQTYARYLPALELKQQQLLLERRKTQAQLHGVARQIAELEQRVHRQLPMLAAGNIDLSGLVQITGIDIATDNLVGVKLPRLADAAIERTPYGMLARPHWVDTLASCWQDMLRLRLEEQVLQQRLTLLEAAVRKITQRVNLFGQVLIPNAKNTIQRIGIFLADQERAAIVRAKIAKQRVQKAERQRQEP